MEKITIDLIAKTDKAVKQVEELKKQVEQLGKSVEKNNETTEKSLKGIKGVAQNVKNGVAGVTNGIKSLGKGLGVFALLVAGLNELKKVFGQNQAVLDIYNVAFESVSIAFNDFVNFIVGNFQNVKDFFNALFTDPLVTMKEFVNVFKQGVIDRFEQFKETLGFIGQGLGQLFKGEFTNAMESFKQAGKESIDIITGQDQSFEQVKNTVVSYTKEVVNTAKANVELQKTAERARVLNQGLIEDYDRQAEKQRQLRDNEFNTIEERIAANDKLKAVLEEQAKTMQENADTVLAAAQAQYNKNQSEENFIALQEAKNEKLAIEAQITGFMSEQDSNRNALLREKLELEQSDIDATTERQKAERDFNSEQIENEYLRLQAQKDNLEEERKVELERLENKKKLYKEGTQAFADANNELLAYDEETKRQQAKIETDLAKAKEQEITNALGNIASIVGENSKFGKGIAVVQAIRDTYAGASKALGQGGIFGFVQAAAIIAAGLRNVKQITATKEPTPPSFAKGSGGGSGASPAIPSAPPAFNVVGASATNQLASVISDQTQQPVKAFVVSNDVTTAQELDRNIVSGATIG
jgi:hypothetical protein